MPDRCQRTSRQLLVLILFAAGLVGFSTFARSQLEKFDSLASFTNPKIQIEIEHPPGLALSIERVAFPPANGPCADEFMTHVQQLFFDQGIEVLDRYALDSVMAEHNLALGDYGNPNSIAAMGEVLGPTALVVVKLYRCDTDQQALYRKTSHGVVFISKMTAYVKGVVQVIDVRSSRIAGSRTIDRTVERKNEATGGYAEFPSEYEVLDEVMAEAANDIHHLFFPWNERRMVVFYNDDKCRLKEASRYLRVGNVDAAFEISKRNVEECQTQGGKPKNVAHAHYNLGLMHAVFSRHDEAIDELETAMSIKSTSAIRTTLAHIRRERDLMREAAVKDDVVARTAAAAEERDSAERQQKESEQERETEEMSLEAQLGRLKSLLDKGLVSQEVYDQQSAEILRRSLDNPN